MSDAEPPTILFICRHGAAKSVLAAALAERRAAELGLLITAVARGIEPDAQLSPQLESALPGIEPDISEPTMVSGVDLRTATTVVTFDLDPSELPFATSTIRWDGIPAVSAEPQAARVALEERIAQLFDGSLDPDGVPG